MGIKKKNCSVQGQYEILENYYLLLRAEKAEKEGFLSVKESEAVLKKLRKKHAKT